MNFMFLVSFCFVIFVVCLQKDCNCMQIPQYEINLDKPAVQRWKDVAQDYAYLFPDMRKILLEVVPQYLLEAIEHIASNIKLYVPEPFAEELIGYANATSCPVVDAVLLNLYYEMTAHCTSFVAQDDQNIIWHGRNMDYDFAPIISKSVISVVFTKNGNVLYRGTTFAGYIGLLTGQRDGIFTVSLNQRNKGTSRWFNALAAIMEHQAMSVGFMLRQTLTEAPSYTEAVKHLTSHIVIAPTYIIVGGNTTGEGVVITRDRFTTADTWNIDLEAKRWYVLETNYDHWLPPPAGDDRRHPAMASLNATGPAGLNQTTVLAVLTKPPVFTVHTIYTVVMSAAHSELYHTWAWKYSNDYDVKLN